MVLEFPSLAVFSILCVGNFGQEVFCPGSSLFGGKWLLPICITVYLFGNAFSDVLSLPNAIIRLPSMTGGVVA